jgi:galactitol-specific phosphotransferase system IIC component
MAFEVEDLFEDVGTPGMIAGIGAVVLAPIVIPAIAKIAKPIAKTALKSGIMLYEKSKAAVVEAGEVFEDLVAEAQAELADEEEIG